MRDTGSSNYRHDARSSTATTGSSRRPCRSSWRGSRPVRPRSSRRPRARRTSSATPSTATRSCTCWRATTSTARARPPPSRRSATGRAAVEGGVTQVRVVGEVDFGPPSGTGSVAALRGGHQPCPRRLAAVGLCVFDTQRLPDQVLESAMRTHSGVVTTDGWAPNPLFTPPAEYVSALPVPAEPLEDTTPRLAALDVTDFIALRHAVAAELSAVDAAGRHRGLPARGRRDELERRPARPAADQPAPVDRTRPDRVHDHRSRPGLGRPLRRLRPGQGEDLSRGGMGLWLARQLCDHVDITTDAEGTRVRLTLAWAEPPRGQ